MSGGIDSLALWSRALAWATARGGSVLALVLDHGLRRGSAEEAARVAAALAGLDAEVRVLALALLPAKTAVQRRAREARLATLEDEAARAGATHLLLGHHRGDQAETLCLRLLDASGPAGLAGIAPLRFSAQVVVARPLLEEGRSTLEARVASLGLAPVSDPSNQDPRFTRARLRMLRGDADGEGAATRALARAARRFAERRAEREARIAALLARAASVLPEGFALLDPAACRGEDPMRMTDALRALVRTVAGLVHARRWQALDGMGHALARGELAPGLVAGGALLRPWRGQLLVAREPALLAPPVAASVGASWDRRWRVVAVPDGAATVAALGEDARLCRAELAFLPAPVWSSLPCFRTKGRLTTLAGLRYGLSVGLVQWQPPEPLAGSACLAACGCSREG